MTPSDAPVALSVPCAAARAPQAHTLRRDELLRVPDDAGALIAVLRGCVWLTRADDADDHFLQAGQTMRVEAGALALLSAEGGSAELLLYRDAPVRAPAGLRASQPPRTMRAPLPMPAAHR